MARHVGLLRCALGLVAASSHCAALGQSMDPSKVWDSSTLFQRTVHVLEGESKTVVAARLASDPKMHSIIDDLMKTGVHINFILGRHANAMPYRGFMSTNATQSREIPGTASYRQIPGLKPIVDPGSSSMPGTVSAPTTTPPPSQNPMEAMEDMLDLLGNDDFLRNFTAMSENIQELSHWLTEQAGGMMDMFLVTENDTAIPVLMADMDTFMRKWRRLNLDWMMKMGQVYLEFTASLPRSMKSFNDTNASAFYMMSNMSVLIEATDSIEPANMSGVSHQVYCPLMTSMAQHADELVKTGNDELKKLKANVKALPMIGQTFNAMIPPEDEEGREMTPRLLYMLSSMINYTYSLGEGMHVYNMMVPQRLAPFMVARLHCNSTEDSAQSGGAIYFRPDLLPFLVLFAAILGVQQ